MRLLDLVEKQRYRTNDKKASSLGLGIVSKTHFAPDGSRLDRPMSQTHIDHIKGRTKENLHRLRPNMGAYGA